MLTIDTNIKVVWIMNNTDNNQIVEDKHSKIEEIKEAMKKTDSKRMYQRYHVIFLHLKGIMNKDIAGIVGLCEHTIGKYVNAYKAEGLEGLKMGKSTGAPNSTGKIVMILDNARIHYAKLLKSLLEVNKERLHLLSWAVSTPKILMRY